MKLKSGQLWNRVYDRGLENSDRIPKKGAEKNADVTNRSSRLCAVKAG